MAGDQQVIKGDIDTIGDDHGHEDTGWPAHRFQYHAAGQEQVGARQANRLIKQHMIGAGGKVVALAQQLEPGFPGQTKQEGNNAHRDCVNLPDPPDRSDRLIITGADTLRGQNRHTGQKSDAQNKQYKVNGIRQAIKCERHAVILTEHQDIGKNNAKHAKPGQHHWRTQLSRCFYMREKTIRARRWRCIFV